MIISRFKFFNVKSFLGVVRKIKIESSNYTRPARSRSDDNRCALCRIMILFVQQMKIQFCSEPYWNTTNCTDSKYSLAMTTIIQSWIWLHRIYLKLNDASLSAKFDDEAFFFVFVIAEGLRPASTFDQKCEIFFLHMPNKDICIFFCLIDSFTFSFCFYSYWTAMALWKITRRITVQSRVLSDLLPTKASAVWSQNTDLSLIFPYEFIS